LGDKQQVGADTLDLTQDRFLGAVADRQHGDHCCDTDDDPQYGQPGAHLVSQQALRSFDKRLHKIHGWFLMIGNHAITDMDDALGLFGDLRIVGDDDQGGALFLIHFHEQFHDLITGF